MKRLLPILALAVLAPQAAAGGSARGYIQAVPVSGKTFPVARSNWYSVINFADDWHAPRMRLIDGRWLQVGVHEGNDIFAEPGTPVRAVVGGIVEQVGWTFYSGWRVGIRDAVGNYWFYAHLSGFAPRAIVGTFISPGERLGSVGNTGYGVEPGHANEFTYHLHIGIQRPDGRWVNPYPLMKRLYAATVSRSR